MKLATALAVTAFALITTASAQTAIPDFSSNGIGWQSGNGGDYVSTAGSPSPTREDPRYPYVPNGTGKQPTFRIGDITNPNLKQWAKDVMKKDNDEVIAGKIAYTPYSTCHPAGVPAADLQGGPFFFVQTPKEVVILMQQDAQIRHIYLDVPHSQDVKPSWYGESVGHYEPDGSLVVDTIGLAPKSFIDSYRTPHTGKLHVIERFKLVNDGKQMQIAIAVDDPDTFNQPWQGTRTYRRISGKLDEEICAENNQHLFDYHIPIADHSDF